MKHYFPTIAILAASLMSTVLVPALKADENNKLTTITIDQSIDVQGTVLPAGSYVIKILGSPLNRFNVLIYNADENHVILVRDPHAAAGFAVPGDAPWELTEGAHVGR